ncbi:Uncharacterised protein [Brucella suis]|nr:Uncharacterised protein [Brucella suis]
MIRLDQGLDPIGILIGCAHHQNIGVGRFLAFPDQRIGFRIKACFKRIIGIDNRPIHIFQRTRQLCSVKFHEFQILRIFRDIRRADFQAFGAIQLDKAIIGQDQKRTSAIGRVVGDGNGGTIGKLGNRLQFPGIHRHGKIDRLGHAHNLEAAIGNLIVEIGLVLEAIGLKRAIRQRHVRHHIVRKLLYLDLDALFGRDFLHLFHDLGVGARRHAYAEGFGEGASCRAKGKNGRCDE